MIYLIEFKIIVIMMHCELRGRMDEHKNSHKKEKI